MKFQRWHGVLAGAIVLALIIGASVKGSGPKGEKVYLEPVGRRDIASIVSAQGEIDPRVKVNISSNVMGKILKLHFKEGDVVRRGQPLVDLERAGYVAQRERIRAELENRRIEVRRSQMGLQNAELQFRRAQRMREQGISAEELFDRARLDYENARSNVAAAQEGVRQAQATLSQANEDLSYTRILAPMSGKVVALHTQEGEVVVTGTMNNPGSVIAVLADLSEVLAQADVSETEVVKVHVGQATTIKVDAIGEKVYHGTVVEIGSSATVRAASSTGVKYFKVKATITDADDPLRPGMTAQVDIITDALKGVIAVPVQCVVERAPEQMRRSRKKASAEDDDLKKKYVLVDDNGKVKAIEVTTGISDATHVAISRGLKGGEKIVTGPFRTIKKLKEGDRIQPGSEKKAQTRRADQDEDDKEDKEKDDDE